MRAFVMLAVLSGAGASAAAPIGPAWRTKLVANHAKECPHVLPLSGALAAVDAGGITLYDAKTGATTKLPLPKVDIPAKSPYLNDIAGDALLVTYEFNVALAIEAKSGALRWRRDLGPSIHRGMIVPLAFAGDAVVMTEDLDANTRTLERIDAATGTSKWKIPIKLHHQQFVWLLVGTSRLFVLGNDRDKTPGGTMSAYDGNGKQLWATDEDTAPFRGAVSGDDLVDIKDNIIRFYAGATGKNTQWQVAWNAGPIAAGDAIYATPVDHTVEARDPATGRIRWTASLPARDGGEYRMSEVIGVAGGLVYVYDDDLLRVLDAKDGTVRGSLAIGASPRSAIKVHAAGPALTLCTERELVAIDPSTPAEDHVVKVSGKIRCRNCERSTELEVRLGDVIVNIGKRRRFAIETKASGTLPLRIRDATFPGSEAVKTIAFTADKEIKLGEISVKVPEMGPGED